MKILGIDPSLRSTGYGIINAAGNEFAAIVAGEIKNPASLLPSRCLVKIADVVTQLIAQHQPEVMAIEGLVFVQNTKIAFTLGEVRGVILAAAAKSGLPIFEYAPRKVKQSVTGQGNAGKGQVAALIKAQLGLRELPPPDAADALAIALCHAQSTRGVQLQPPRQL
ncbi:MAG: Crossover junction endodeoxyribonuclease RuvC [Verrucomicrobiae bacterium]|nr:Crossover junction endodeoxyribonuclease RuvC [Verrucomicrobiae bacterium]